VTAPSDEPALGQAAFAGGEAAAFGRAEVGALVHGEAYGVLCSQGGGQPYGSLLAFASGDDLRELAFATPVTTRKYALLSACDRVAFLVDDRARGGEIMDVAAVTAVGRAEELSGAAREAWAERLVARHPHLASFVRAPTCAVFRIAVERYFHVTRFQEVHEWRP
jgi:nitroimidazol reductase NimA-like FMN-containing flavoprotein (pyridoxamine 5'-phosphate oxidase superfamily)